MIGYEKPIIYLGGEYIGYRVKDNEKLAPDDNELCPVTFLSQGKPDYPLLGQMFYPVELKKSTLK